MKYIIPLPALAPTTLVSLRKIFQSTTQIKNFHMPDRIKITNHFIDNHDDFKFIVENIIKPVGIDPNDIKDTWSEIDPEYNNKYGINFNVCAAGDFIGPHCDKTPAKLNILISEKVTTSIKFTGYENSETWDWRTPALIDVSKKHFVDPLPLNATCPRITMQIFINKSFDYYKDIINTSPDW
jgi:hypothetical protein